MNSQRQPVIATTPAPTECQIAAAVSLACTLEVMAPKAGNVYPGKEFSDLGVVDFLMAARACSEVLAEGRDLPVGKLVVGCVDRSRRVTRSNANLGIVLLLAPLVKAAVLVSDARDWNAFRLQLGEVLRVLSPADSQDVYTGIQMAAAGGLGEQSCHDVNTPDCPSNLLEAMALAKDRDRIALQYCTVYECIFNEIAPGLEDAIGQEHDVLRGISKSQLQILGAAPDSLIARKCGIEIAKEAQNRATSLVDAGSWEVTGQQWRDFDAWLRADGNARNPGTTADLIVAGLFVLMITGRFDCLVTT